MRILASRHHWYPRTRIDGLRRFAFIGDSNVFGQGVTAGEAFPARAGVLMNEATPAPVEAVNLGVNGYNIWNSWLSFKELPQVYDGVVFTLCNNDAQLFGRSFAVDYRNADHALWKPDHAYRSAIVECFDEIAAFARRIPIFMCYCNLWAGKAFEEIADTMRALCEARDLPFLNFYTHFVERRIPRDDLIVADADHHPSPLAHDAMARHLVQALRKAGWLAPPVAEGLAGVSGAAETAAAALVAQDFYPSDAAITWAMDTLDAKKRLAARLEHAPGILSGADRAALRLERTRRAWQGQARTAAIVDQLSTSERGLAGALNHAEEETLRLEELDHAIDRAGWAQIAADLLNSLPDASQGTAPGAATGLRTRITALRSGLERLGAPDASAPGGEDSPFIRDADRQRHLADLDDARRLATVTAERLSRFDAAHARIEARLASGKGLDRDTALVLSTLANRSATMAMERFERLGEALRQLSDVPQPDAAETTIAVSVRTNRIEGRHPCLVEVIGNYTAPRRLPVRESRYFLPDGEPKTLSMRLPLFYAGRLVLSLRLPPAVAGMIEADVEDVRLVNASGQRTIARREFISDNLGRLLSPQVWLV